MSDDNAPLAICRLCLYNTSSCYNAFSRKMRDSKMPEKILKYIYLEIKEDDPFPNDICFKCIGRLDDFHFFCESVISNQDVFRFSSHVTPSSDAESGDESETAKIGIKDENISVTKVTGYQYVIEDRSESAKPHSSLEQTSQTQSDPHHATNLVNLTIHTLSGAHDSAKLETSKRQKNVRKSSAVVPAERPEQKEATQTEDLAESFLNYESDSSEYLNQFDDDVIVLDFNDVQPSKSDEHVEMEVGDGDTEAVEEVYEADHQFAGFPKVLIRDAKLIVRGAVLIDLLSRFFQMECDLCPDAKSKTRFADLEALCHHYSSVHDSKGYVSCCGSKLIKPRAMALHMARHLQPSAFKCTICGKVMTCPKILRYHLQNHLPEEQRPLACPLCPRKFSYSSALMAHAISHKPEEEREAHVCDECGKSFSSPGRLSTHMNMAHATRGQDYICHICARQFTSRSNLKYHLTTHQPRVHQVQCTQCHKWLKNKLCLRKHMTQHSEVRYTCDRCDYSALNRQCLRNHIKVHHTDVKSFNCEHCDKSFKLSKTLTNHMVQHTGVRKYSCEFCSRTFASSGNYYSHRKRMHPVALAAVNKQKADAEDEFRTKVMLDHRQ